MKGKSQTAANVTEKGKQAWKIKDMHITMLKKQVCINKQNELLF